MNYWQDDLPALPYYSRRWQTADWLTLNPFLTFCSIRYGQMIVLVLLLVTPGEAPALPMQVSLLPEDPGPGGTSTIRCDHVDPT